MLLAERTIGGFPLSIGTSLSFESLFEPRLPVYDPERVIPNRIDIGNYDQLWINLETLYRNIVTSVPRVTYDQIKPLEIKEAMEYEIHVIESLLETEGRNQVPLVMYGIDYPDLKGYEANKIIELRQPTTDAKKEYVKKQQDTFELFLKEKANKIYRFKNTLEPFNPKKSKVLIMTHHAYDLLSYSKFRQLDLLESHTGKLKPRNQWYSKYYPIPEANMSIFPFLKVLLFVLGDHIDIKPYPIKIRHRFMEIAKKRLWTPNTTRDKVLMDIELDIMDPLLLSVLKSVK